MNLASRYYGIHAELRRDRGLATGYPCAECGDPAHHWAYDHDDADELRDVDVYGSRVTYSTKAEHYEALCSACHHLRDNPPKDVCKRGHKIEGDNVYVRPNGGRLCRECRRETQREWREANPGWREGMYA